MSPRDEHKRAKEVAEQLSEQDLAAMMKVAKLFDTADGKEVLALLCRRFGVLNRRFRTKSPGGNDANQAAIHDGEAGAVLFILKCLKESGVTTITLDL